MDRVLWLGPRHPPAELAASLAAGEIELLAFDSVEAAVADILGLPLAVAVIDAAWDEAVAAIERLTAARPGLQVLLATDLGIPRPVVLSLWAGASGLLELRNESLPEMVLQIQEWVSRSRQAAHEQEMLTRLYALNEEFLKHMVTAERRALELEERLQPAGELAAGEGPIRVLVVDDEEVVRDVLGKLLGKKGYAVVAVESGEEAVAALGRRERFQLVITDKNLPGSSGLEVVREVKRRSPDTEVILMTGYSSTSSAIDALNFGASAYLEKPFDQLSHVLARIEEVLARQRDRVRKQRYLHLIKERNRAFLEKYRAIRADLEAWLKHRGYQAPDPPEAAGPEPAEPPAGVLDAARGAPTRLS